MIWVAVLLLIVVGILGTVLPGLPGPILIFAGLLLAAWYDSFERIGPGALVGLAALTLAAHVVDLIFTAIGVKYAGASRRAVAGAALGALGGLFFGLPGLVVGPLVGAMLGELSVGRDVRAAGRAGLAAWLGLAAGAALKIAIVAAMIGIAIAAFFF